MHLIFISSHNIYASRLAKTNGGKTIETNK